VNRPQAGNYKCLFDRHILTPKLQTWPNGRLFAIFGLVRDPMPERKVISLSLIRLLPPFGHTYGQSPVVVSGDRRLPSASTHAEPFSTISRIERRSRRTDLVVIKSNDRVHRSMCLSHSAPPGRERGFAQIHAAMLRTDFKRLVAGSL
jgi:hypothetical protein